MTGNSYIEVSLESDPQLLDHLVGVLSQIGFEGFWEDGNVLRGYVRSTRWSPELHSEIESLVRLVARPSSSPAPRISIRTLQDLNWNEAWEKTIQPIQATQRILIAPTWHEAKPGEDGILIRIDPKMSFGTGYHESTRLMLRLLEKYMKDGFRVLDVGTGTGILAIAAAKLGAMSVVGVDVDECAYRNALENIGRNDAAGTVRVIHGELQAVPPGQYELIAANIQRDVLENLLGEMLLRLATGGVLLLSGLLLEDRDQMTATLQSTGFHIREEIHENQWIALAGSADMIHCSTISSH